MQRLIDDCDQRDLGTYGAFESPLDWSTVNSLDLFIFP